MQKTKVNFDTVYEFETLYNAYRASRRGKRWKNTVAKVEMNALEAIAVLQEELSTGTYRPGGYREFYVFEPKKRLIQTNSFKDKIVQHAFCDTILYDVLTRPFILDNYGSQIGKGTHFGLNRLRDFVREYYRRHGSAERMGTESGRPPLLRQHPARHPQAGRPGAARRRKEPRAHRPHHRQHTGQRRHPNRQPEQPSIRALIPQQARPPHERGLPLPLLREIHGRLLHHPRKQRHPPGRMEGHIGAPRGARARAQ